jgi:hypothetical protein
LLTPVRGIKCLDKIALEFIPIKVKKFPVWHKNQIMTWRKNPLVRAEQLPDQPFGPVSLGGSTNFSAGTYPDSTVRQTIPCNYNSKTRQLYSFPLLIDPGKILRACQSLFF